VLLWETLHEDFGDPSFLLRAGRAALKSQLGPPVTLGNAAAARVRLIVWCKLRSLAAA
jgi:hypothetical protein